MVKLVDEAEEPSSSEDEGTDTTEGDSSRPTEMDTVADVHSANEAAENLVCDQASDSDEEPEDVSLTESKKRAAEGQKMRKDFSKNVREHKKKTLQERENRNKEQRVEKRQKKSYLPDKLDENILELVDEDIDVTIPTDSVTKPKERKNTKIVFSDDDDDEEEDFEEEEIDEKEGGKIEARCLKNVEKDRANNSAEEFLKLHFFGDRVKRDDLMLHNPHKKRKANDTNRCNVAWLEKRK